MFGCKIVASISNVVYLPSVPTGFGYVRALFLSWQVGESAAMDAATMYSSPLADEQLGFELPNKNDDHAVCVINTGHTEEANAPSTSEHPTIPPGYATTFSATNIKQTLHPKHVCE